MFLSLSILRIFFNHYKIVLGEYHSEWYVRSQLQGSNHPEASRTEACDYNSAKLEEVWLVVVQWFYFWKQNGSTGLTGQNFTGTSRSLAKWDIRVPCVEHQVLVVTKIWWELFQKFWFDKNIWEDNGLIFSTLPIVLYHYAYYVLYFIFLLCLYMLYHSR